MACKIPNFDELLNLVKNKQRMYEIPADDDYENIEARLKHTQDTIKPIPDKDRHGYHVGEHEFKYSASQIAKEKFGKHHDSKDPVYSDIGNSMHKFMEIFLNGEDPGFEQNGWKINREQYDKLKQIATDIKEYANKRQRQIDSTKSVKIFTEQRVSNPRYDRTSTADLIIVFSDGSALLYDFKTRIFGEKQFTGQIFDNPDLLVRKFREHEIQLAVMARDLKENYGVKEIIGGRVVPIVVAADITYNKNTGLMDIKSNTFKRMDTPFAQNTKLKQALLLAEKTRIKNIDSFISKQYAKIKKLEMSGKDQDIFDADILRAEVSEVVLYHNFNILADNFEKLYSDYRKRQNETKYKADGTENEKYYSDDELNELYSKAKSLSLMLKDMYNYYNKMEASPSGAIKSQEVKEIAGNLIVEVNNAIADIDILVTQRHVAGVLGNKVLDEEGKLKLQRGDGYFTNTLLGLGDQQNYILRAMNELKLQNENEVNTGLDEFIEEWVKINNSLNTWIRENNNILGVGGRNALVELVYNSKTKNLIAQIDKKFFDERKKRIKASDLKWLKQHYEPIITEKEFLERRKVYEDKLKLQGLSDQVIKSRLKFYDSKNNLWAGSTIDAWSNSRVTKIKEFVYSDSKWITPEYAKIMNTPVGEFYRFYKDNMYKFLRMVDRPDKTSTFVPWVRQGLVDGLLQNGIKGEVFLNSLMNTISARNDSSYLSHDEFGRLEQEVPVYFMNPTFDLDGNPVPGEEKSLDFMNSLLVFGKMAMTYRAAKRNVGIANMLLEAYNNQMLLETDIKGKLQKQGTGFAVRPVDPIEREIAQAFRDYYWYGIEMRSKDRAYKIAGRDISRIETLRFLKSNWTTMTLSFGLKQSAGGYIAAVANRWIDGNKGIYYTTKQFNNAAKLYAKERSKAVALGLFVDVYSDDVIERKLKAAGMDPMETGKFMKEDAVRTFSDTRYAEWFRRWHYERMGMGVWKHESEIRDNALILAVAQNFGVNKENELVRFKRDYFEKDGITLKQEYKDLGYKSIYDVFSYDEKNGPQFVLDGATDAQKQKVFIKFREAVKRIKSGISGEVTSEEKSYVNMTIWGQLLMQYRSWIPGIIREWYGGIKYDHRTMSVHQGRHNVFYKHLFQDTSKMDMKYSEVVVGAVKRLGEVILEASYIPYAYRAMTNKETRFEPELERVKIEYKVWAEENPDQAEEIDLEGYVEMRMGQLNAMVGEVRMILLFLSVLGMLTAWMNADDDDEDEWPLRFTYSIFRKGYSELTFPINLSEYGRAAKNPIPLMSIPETLLDSSINTFDELRDGISGENSPRDQSPWFHYSRKFGFGLVNIERLIEWTEADKEFLQDSPITTNF